MKYVIDTDDYKGFAPKYCLVFGDGGYGLDMLDIFTELTAEYVNEHFGSLQDDAYNKGLEDGKKENRTGVGCETCEWYGSPFTGDCNVCCRNYEDKYEQKQKEDAEIKVGDEVKSIDGLSTGIATYINSRGFDIIHSDGSVEENVARSEWRKTGKHYDIAQLLAKMKGGDA